MTGLVVCAHRWMAPRVEVLSGPVEHVCSREPHHADAHFCACGAEIIGGAGLELEALRADVRRLQADVRRLQARMDAWGRRPAAAELHVIGEGPA